MPAAPQKNPSIGQQVQAILLPLIQQEQASILAGTALPADYQNLANYITIWNYYSSFIQSQGS